MNEISLSRRAFAGAALAFGASGLLTGNALAALPERRLAFRNVHTNERVDARYYGADGYDREGLAEINHGLRDWRTGTIHPIDHDLLNLLTRVRDTLGLSEGTPFDLISGYRSPATNAMLREEGGAHTGVASRSQHLIGKATDVRLSGVPLAKLRLAALHLQGGGVGYYPRDGFVHIDSGPVRMW